jgi:phosphotransacetylase
MGELTPRVGLPGFGELHELADRRPAPARIAVAGGDESTVLESLGIAVSRGWVQPVLFGSEPDIRGRLESLEIPPASFDIRAVSDEDAAPAAVAEVTAGRCDALMKGQIPTPTLMRAVLDPEHGLRSDRVICQVVLMEIPRDGRRFLLADTGISIKPSVAKKADILRSAVEVARALGVQRPRVAVMAATESVTAAMPETLHAQELARRQDRGDFGACHVEGPLSFDLAYAEEAGAKKRVGGNVVGSADVMLFPDLLSANLTVKGIMYTADCRFGGILRGTSAPVVFMSRADTTQTRLNSLALALVILERQHAKT